MAKKITTPTAPASIASLSAALVAPAASAKPQISTAPAEKGIANRATWTGVLGFGLVNLTVKTLKATEEEKVELNQVHHCNSDKTGMTPIYTQLKRAGMSCPTCNETVEGTNILKGYQYAKGEFAIISDDEKKGCSVNSDKRMTVEKFVKMTSIDPIYFADAEYLVPDKGFEETFSTLRAAMVGRGVVAIAQTAQRGREQTVVIRPYGTNGMVVHYMYFDNEVRSCDKWQTVAVDDKKVELAAMLIDMLSGDFDATDYEDSFTRSFKGLINDKIMGRTPAPVALPAPAVTSPVDVMAMLQASLNQPVAVKAKKAKAVAA